MFGISTPRKKGKIVFAADIGSGHVEYCLVEIRHGGIPAILTSSRLNLPFEERTPEQIKSGILSLFGELCTKAAETYAQASAKKKMAPISAAYAILQAPWSHSEIAHLESEFKTDEKITGKIIEELARQALEKDDKLNHQNLFEAGVMRVELNEYPTAKPIGKQAHAVAVSTLISECEPEFRTKITETLQHSFPSATPNLRSRVRALSSALREVRSQSRDCVIVDVENEATNCIVIRDGVVSDHVIAQEGTRTILKRISSGMPDEALSLMRMISRGTCSTAECEKMNASLAQAEPDIVRIFGDALGHLVGKRRLSNELVLIVEPALSEWLSALFSRIDFCQFTVTTRPFEPVLLTPDALRDSVSSYGGANDAGFALVAIFVNTEEKN